jgi:acyl-coenzyme A synthetase/AMP-(fatty) acid ligase
MPSNLHSQSHESQLTVEEAEMFIEARMSKHKRLTAGVYLLDAITRTPSGKVIRQHLQSLRHGTGVKIAEL